MLKLYALNIPLSLHFISFLINFHFSPLPQGQTGFIIKSSTNKEFYDLVGFCCCSCFPKIEIYILLTKTTDLLQEKSKIVILCVLSKLRVLVKVYMSFHVNQL